MLAGNCTNIFRDFETIRIHQQFQWKFRSLHSGCTNEKNNMNQLPLLRLGTGIWNEACLVLGRSGNGGRDLLSSGTPNSGTKRLLCAVQEKEPARTHIIIMISYIIEMEKKKQEISNRIETGGRNQMKKENMKKAHQGKTKIKFRHKYFKRL